MITARKAVEHALVPMLLESYLRPLAKTDKKYKNVLRVLGDEYKSYLGNDIKLLRRGDRIANKIIRYTVKNKFDSRKAILAITKWLTALIESGWIELQSNTEYWELLEELGEIIQSGYIHIEDFDKIDTSAINHVPKIHAIAQKEGYFVN